MTFEPKRLDVLLETSRRFLKGLSRLSQVANDGFHFALQEGVPVRMVMQGLQFFYQLWAIVNPSVKGLDGTLLGAVRTPFYTVASTRSTAPLN